jgi:serine/threonine protein kinase
MIKVLLNNNNNHKGILRITDFGVARVWHPDNARDTSGTPGYMAPEVMCR